ncbi:hypothetical protein [Curtobacterium sp. MCBA15_008]|uniref:hypothetical protein n=1 Tax=Curtobacterium sp. MCBA15_008 TaxID=1898736 RepID=UPI0008DCC760|nr:hypothetical protein [Curtobacterium sp. MCBA15_008]OII04306.1 hypothetical protein BIU96_07860 [Curtobacterium sp. MCBA15_008]
MAGMSQAFQATVQDRLGYIPDGLSTAIGPLLAAQRDSYVLAYLTAPEEQRARPAETWLIPEEDRDLFETFRLHMQDLGL